MRKTEILREYLWIAEGFARAISNLIDILIQKKIEELRNNFGGIKEIKQIWKEALVEAKEQSKWQNVKIIVKFFSEEMYLLSLIKERRK